MAEHIGLGTQVAAVDLTAKEYHIGDLDANSKVVVAGAGGGKGVIKTPVAQDVAVGLAIIEEYRVKVGGVLAVNTWFTSDANGKAVAAATGNTRVGYTLEASSAADQIVRAMILATGAKQ